MQGLSSPSIVGIRGAHERDPRAHIYLIRPVHCFPTHNRCHNFPAQLRSAKWGIVRPRVRLRSVKRPALGRIEDGDVGVAAADERSPASQSEHSCRSRGEEVDNSAEGHFLSTMQMGDRKAQSSFQPCDPERGALELDNLFMRRVRGVIGGDGIDGSVSQGDQDRLPICRRAQRRVHLEVGVILSDIRIRQREVVWGDFTGHVGLAAFSSSNRLQRVGGRDVRHVQAGAGELLG